MRALAYVGLGAALGAALCSAHTLQAQDSAATTLTLRPALLETGGDLAIGGDAERYLRVLLLSGRKPTPRWTIRAPGALGLTATVPGSHPWQHRFVADSARGRFRFDVLRPGARLVYNSTFPVSTTDGPTWTGRGLTGELRAGVRAEYGPLHLQLAPIAFLAENAPFALATNGESGRLRFADARFPEGVDAPQRFGSGSYGRIDAGNSTLSLETRPITLGISTAAESWGPAREYPLVLGSHSGGFPHAFVGTGEPLNLYLVNAHLRVIAGNLYQSDWSPIDTGSHKRWMSAGILSLSPRGVNGLEFGVMRFVSGISHTAVPTLAQVRRVLQGATLNNSSQVVTENQIASAFFRWAFPGSGFEIYGEYAREDYSLDLRRFLQYPDDLRGYVFGFQRILQNSATTQRVVRFELVNAELSSSNRGERGDPETKVFSGPFPIYLHNVTRQGHTNRGLFLGSAEAYGGAGWRLGFDRYSSRGRHTLTLERSLRLDWLPGLPITARTVQPDVVYGVGAEALRFRGAREYGLSLSGQFNLNRNLVPGNDVFNVRAAFVVRGWR
ncbi:MAG: hypothetical protein ACO1Q7_16180 [Gemmatimonas sp.]